MTDLPLADLRTLAWRTLPCRSCSEPAGRRCITASGVRTTPHVPRMDDIAAYLLGAASKDAEIADLTGRAGALGSQLTESDAALARMTTERDDLKIETQRLAGEVTGLNEHVSSLTHDLEATIAERDVADKLAAEYAADILTLQRRVDELTKPAPEPSPTPTPQPAGKMLVGAAVGGNADPAPVEKALGRPLGLRRTYWQASQVASAVTTAKADLAAGRIPFLSFKLPASWVDMAAGKQDAWVTGLRDKLAALGGPVWVVFHHEPEGDGNMADWLAMQKHILPLVTKGQIIPGVCVTGYQQVTGGAITFSDCWPGDVAKFLAVDLYQRYGTVKAGKKQTTWTDLRGQLAKVNAFAKSVGVPWVNAETGITDEALAVRPSSMGDLFADHRVNDSAGLCYFSSSLNSVGTWPLSGAKLTAFAKAASA